MVDIAQSLAQRGINTHALYLGQVATRGLVPTTINTSYQQLNAQRLHIARDTITTLRIAFANWFVNTAAGEQAGSGQMVVTASIQYPIGSGTWQQFKWSNAASATVADGATSALSDELTLTTAIPPNAPFLIRSYATFATGIVFFQNNVQCAIQNGDFMEFAASGLADKTTSGAGIPSAGTTTFGPCLLVAQTRRVSVLGLGDSRMKGQGDPNEGAGDTGDTMRSIGPAFAYTNAGCAGELLNGFLANNSRRLALAPYFSHVHCNYGINDVNGGRTTTQLVTDINSFLGLSAFANKKIAWNTLYPYTTSSDNWATTAGQTVNANDSVRASINDGLRNGRYFPSKAPDYVFDVAGVVETAANGGKFVTGPGGQSLTGDGLHMSAVGTKMVQNSGIIATARMTR